jgi:hypothetical protein
LLGLFLLTLLFLLHLHPLLIVIRIFPPIAFDIRVGIRRRGKGSLCKCRRRRKTKRRIRKKGRADPFFASKVLLGLFLLTLLFLLHLHPLLLVIRIFSQDCLRYSCRNTQRRKRKPVQVQEKEED